MLRSCFSFRIVKEAFLPDTFVAFGYDFAAHYAFVEVMWMLKLKEVTLFDMRYCANSMVLGVVSVRVRKMSWFW